MVPLVDPFRTGKEPVLLIGAVTVSLLDAEGCLPPPLIQAYTALAVAESVIDSVDTVVPSPASLKVALRTPVVVLVAVAI